MLPSIGDALTVLGHRFFTTIWLPVQLLVVAVGAIVFTAVGWHDIAREWADLTGASQVAATSAALAASTTLAYLVAARLSTIMRALEGYWPDVWGARSATRWGTQRQKAERARLMSDPSTSAAAVVRYPGDEAAVLPTRFGNIMRATELHPYQRYRIDAVVFWPRLYACLPDAVVQKVAAAKADLDRMIVLSFSAGMFTVIAPIVSLTVRLPAVALIAVITGPVIARLSYTGGLAAATTYSTVVRAAFDVHRYAILDTLSWRRPVTWQDERRQWQAIARLWARGGPESADDAQLLGYDSAEAIPGGSTPTPR